MISYDNKELKPDFTGNFMMCRFNILKGKPNPCFSNKACQNLIRKIFDPIPCFMMLAKMYTNLSLLFAVDSTRFI